MENKGPRRRLTGIFQVSVREYTNGEAELLFNRWDPSSKRFTPASLGTVDQPAQFPFTPHELLLMAALEHYAQREDVGEALF